MFNQASNYFGAIPGYRRLKWIPIFAALGIDIGPIFDQVSNYFGIFSYRRLESIPKFAT
jgi:hypothetical protein